MNADSGGGPLAAFKEKQRGMNTPACDFLPTGLG